MNLLGHVWLSPYVAPDDPVLAGNLAGDGYRGAIEPTLPAGIAAGLRLHRRIDKETDRHPAFLAWKHELPYIHQRLGGIAFDLIGDYLLARECRPAVLRSLNRRAARAIQTHAAHLPPEAVGLARRLVQDEILVRRTEWAEVLRQARDIEARRPLLQARLVPAVEVAAKTFAKLREAFAVVLANLEAHAFQSDGVRGAEGQGCSRAMVPQR